MRITGGKARGIPLNAPRGSGTRPATDRMREALFSSLGADVEGRDVADLFAGTGAYGLEALSRGARSCLFVENDRRALACLRANVAAVLRSAGLDPGAAPIDAVDARRIPAPVRPFDLVFLDPPYRLAESELPRLFAESVTPGAGTHTRVVLELPGHLEPDLPGWTAVRRIGKPRRDRPSVLLLERNIPD